MMTKGHNFGFAVNYGRAGYVATGRGYTIDSSSLVEMYSNYAASHIYFGSEVFVLLLIYERVKLPSKTIIPSLPMRSLCAAWRKAHPNYRDDDDVRPIRNVRGATVVMGQDFPPM